MIDHIRTLLLNPTTHPGYRRVTDAPSDVALSLFGLANDGSAADGSRVDRLLPLALAPDLVSFRTAFDPRRTPTAKPSVYAQTADTLATPGLHHAVLGSEGWWRISDLFLSDDAALRQTLQGLRDAAASKDAPFALGAVLLACAHRRLKLQGGD